MPKTKEEQNKQLLKLVESYNKAIKTKGHLEEWTDVFLLKTRDKFRLQARKFRGEWFLDFFEILQDINKESIKRDLTQITK